MTTFEKNSLFKVLSEEESATIGGGGTSYSGNVGSAAVYADPYTLLISQNFSYAALEAYYEANKGLYS